MDASKDAIWFIGDLSDPWVVAIAEALPASFSIVRIECTDDLPDVPVPNARPPRLIVVHRNRLSAADAEQLRSWRTGGEPASVPALFLCVSPFVRYEDLERWSGVADLVLSEATAADFLPRHVTRLLVGRENRTIEAHRLAFRIEVAGGNHELCLALGEACAGAGYRVEEVGDVIMRENARLQTRPAAPRQRVLTIWDVPVLEPGWSERLERYSHATGPVIALVGFADRNTVGEARARGAVACLELPYNVDDLLGAIDRTARSLSPESWPLPARVELPHLLPPRPRRRGRQRESASATPPWSDHDPVPTIP